MIPLRLLEIHGANGPLPPGEYDLPNAYSPTFKRIVPSPTNTGVPGVIATPAGTQRGGIRWHKGTHSEGCFTTGPGQRGSDAETMVRDIVNRNSQTGGTRVIIQEIDCGC